MKTIIAIGAHHDDVELRSGGTLAKYACEGHRVIYVVATTTPHYSPFPKEQATGEFRDNAGIIELRKQESRKGAEALGIKDVEFFDFKSLYWYKEGTMERRYFDGRKLTRQEFDYLNNNLPGREFIVTAHYCNAACTFLSNFLEEKKADIVLTHFPDDHHFEHYATANFVWTVVQQLSKKGRPIDCYAWECGGENTLVRSFAPTHYVDISGTIDQKCDALMAFESQFKDHNPQPFVDRARARARAYGELVGFEYAEPFVRFEGRRRQGTDPEFAPGYQASGAKKGLG